MLNRLLVPHRERLPEVMDDPGLDAQSPCPGLARALVTEQAQRHCSTDSAIA